MAKPSKKPKTIKSLSERFNVAADDFGVDMLHFHVEPGETIETIAPFIVKEMINRDMDAEIHFKKFIYTVERDQSVDFIVENYYGALEMLKDILAEQRRQNKAANQNKGPKK